MSIIFLILKILGILILIPIVLILILLICPISYRVEADFDGEKPRGKFKLSWALFIVRIKAAYEEGTDFVVRIFGIPLYRSDSKRWSLLGGESEEVSEIKAPEKKKTKSKKKQTEHKKSVQNEIRIEEEKTDPEDVFDLPWEEEEKISRETVFGKKASPLEEKSVFGKRIVEFLKKCYNKCKCVIGKIQRFTEKMEAVGELFSDEEILDAVHRIKKYGVDGVRLLIPQKINGSIEFGTTDPALTGKILGYLAMMMPIYTEHLNITPDFTQEILKGNVMIRGRIRRYKILMLLWKVYKDKDLLKQKDRVVAMIGG